MSNEGQLRNPLDDIRLSAIEALLSECTEAQQALFRRMYPDGPLPDQMDVAYNQIQRTLAKLRVADPVEPSQVDPQPHDPETGETK